MKQNKDWTDVMRSARRGTEVIPPADGWARLERELGPHPRISVLRSHWPRIAPDFSILAAWRHQGKVAAKIESYQKMKRYRENQEAAGNQATAEKPGGFGKAKGGGGPYWVPPPPLQKERCAISRGLAAEGATPPRGYAAKGLRRRRALLPRGFAAKGLCRQGAVPPRAFIA